MAAAQPYPRPRRRARRRSHAGRYAAALAYFAALGLVLFLAAPAYRARGPAADRTGAAPLTARPAHLPAFIPSWAWEMSAWHATPGSERGRRPRGAPHPLPGWYWTWHAWRMQVERHAAA